MVKKQHGSQAILFKQPKVTNHALVLLLIFKLNNSIHFYYFLLCDSRLNIFGFWTEQDFWGRLWRTETGKNK